MYVYIGICQAIPCICYPESIQQHKLFMLCASIESKIPLTKDNFVYKYLTLIELNAGEQKHLLYYAIYLLLTTNLKYVRLGFVKVFF